MSIGSRIKELRIKQGMTQEELAKRIGVSKGAIANYENEVSSPKIELMYKLFDALDCDANYLHQDEMKALTYKNKATPEEFENIIKKYRLLDDHGQETVTYILDRELERTEQLEKAAAISQRPNTRIIQYYQKLASAGTGQVIFDDMLVERIEIPDIPEYKRASYAISVNGNSMEPLYYDGDILLIEPTCQINVGEIGIFIVGNEAYVKKLGKKELISLNKECDNIPLTEDSKRMGKVVGRLKG